MQRIASLLALLIFTASAAATSPVEEENIYFDYLTKLESLTNYKTFDRQLIFDLWAESASENLIQQGLFAKAFGEILATQSDKAPTLSLLSFKDISVDLHFLLTSVSDKSKDYLLESKVKIHWSAQNPEFERLVCSQVHSPNNAIQQLFTNNSDIHKHCLKLHSAIQPPSRAQIIDLVTNTPDARNYKDGEFYKKPVIFQFCRTNRNYPCLQVIKDGDGRWVRDSNGKIWSQGKLSLSRLGREYNEFNGETPAGIYTLDGVMPYADRPEIYGRYRRLIMTFVPTASNETLIKSLLPPSHHSENWWKESVVARDMGRSALRIHGTLRRNDDKSSSYYPYYPTFGCVASLEDTYDGVTYIDQRLLLDQLMQQQGLQPIYENETRIRARFYVVEINDQAAPVTLNDLRNYGIQ